MTIITVSVDYLSPIVARYHSKLVSANYSQTAIEGSVVTFTLECNHDSNMPNTVKHAIDREVLAGRRLSVTIVDLHRSVFDEVSHMVSKGSTACHSYCLGRPSQCWVTATY